MINPNRSTNTKDEHCVSNTSGHAVNLRNLSSKATQLWDLSVTHRQYSPDVEAATG